MFASTLRRTLWHGARWAGALVLLGLLPWILAGDLEASRRQLQAFVAVLALLLFVAAAGDTALLGWRLWSTRKPPVVFPAGQRPCSAPHLHNFPSPKAKCRWCKTPAMDAVPAEAA